MENKPTNLELKNIRDVKTYSLVWFQIHETLSCSQVYLVDKKAHKIWMFEMNHPATDETKRSQRMYETDRNKDWEKRRIGGELFKLMENHDDYIAHFKVIAHSDSALEITEKVHELRALQAEHYLRICRNHCHWASEEAAVEHFSSL